MTEHGILFSGAMVRALLAGRKTQTRRAVKPEDAFRPYYDEGRPVTPGECETGEWGWFADGHECVGIIGRCPHPVGTRLYVRETTHPGETCVLYRADGPGNGDAQLLPGSKWTPSLLMPRSRARIFLDVTGVRVERAQSISDADIAAEGVDAEAVRALASVATMKRRTEALSGAMVDTMRPAELWRAAWTLINGRASWDANPWVWVYEFNRTEAGR